MKKMGIFAAVLLLSMLFILTGCQSNGTTITATIDKEFILSTGQTAKIESENIRITFKDVTDDSRCPRNVECVWAGIASCLIQFEQEESSNNIVLVQPGGSTSAETVFENYEITFNLKPYPESLTEIAKSDYLLYMKVKKQ